MARAPGTAGGNPRFDRDRSDERRARRRRLLRRFAKTFAADEVRLIHMMFASARARTIESRRVALDARSELSDRQEPGGASSAGDFPSAVPVYSGPFTRRT